MTSDDEDRSRDLEEEQWRASFGQWVQYGPPVTVRRGGIQYPQPEAMKEAFHAEAGL